MIWYSHLFQNFPQFIVEYYSTIKRNRIVLFAETCVDLEMVIQTEVNHKKKNKFMLF